MALRLVCVHGRWQFIGEYWREQGRAGVRGLAVNIRRWGTDKGLWQLKERPLKEGETQYAPTILDPVADYEWPLVNEGPSFEVDQVAWQKAINDTHGINEEEPSPPRARAAV